MPWQPIKWAETAAGTDGPYRSSPLQPCAGAQVHRPIACETVIAIPINGGLFPAHAVGFGDHFASGMPCWSRACFSVPPGMSPRKTGRGGHKQRVHDREYARLGQDRDARADTDAPAPDPFLIPMTTEMLSDALPTSTAGSPPPPPTDKEKFVRRTPTENIAPGIANKNAIRSPPRWPRR